MNTVNMVSKCVFLLLCCVIVAVQSNAPASRSARRIHIPWLGIGPTCTGCPEHYCDDDPAINHGYCCGCAGLFDSLPVSCSDYMQCPLNGDQLCRDYEYMMHCCCD